MQSDWIPPDASGAEGVGSDEDLDERQSVHPDFLGEFGEREEPAGADAGEEPH